MSSPATLGTLKFEGPSNEDSGLVKREVGSFGAGISGSVLVPLLGGAKRHSFMLVGLDFELDAGVLRTSIKCSIGDLIAQLIWAPIIRGS